MRAALYLAGPMSNIADLNFPAFSAMTDKLRTAGFEVISPHEVNPDPGMTWSDAMRKDIPELCKCHAIATLDGWENSKGATLEVHIARQLGMPVLTAEQWLSVRNGF